MSKSSRDDREESVLLLLLFFFEKTLSFSLLSSTFMHPFFTPVDFNVSDAKYVLSTLMSPV